MTLDLWYIFFNSIVYGIIATVFAWFFAYSKFLNLSIGGFLVLLWYNIQSLVTWSWSLWWQLLISLFIIGLYVLLVRWMQKRFRHESQRDHAGIIITLWLVIVLENLTNYLYWPNSVSLPREWLSSRWLWILFVILLAGVRYLFNKSSRWVIYKWIYENSKTIRSLGIRVDRSVLAMSIVFFVLLIIDVVLILTEVNIRASDGLFYMIKGIGIMIMVGVHKKEYMFVWALLYVLIEYLLFITRGLPIAYKETLILWIILLLLLIKPEWIFTLSKRNV